MTMELAAAVVEVGGGALYVLSPPLLSSIDMFDIVRYGDGNEVGIIGDKGDPTMLDTKTKTTNATNS